MSPGKTYVVVLIGTGALLGVGITAAYDSEQAKPVTVVCRQDDRPGPTPSAECLGR